MGKDIGVCDNDQLWRRWSTRACRFISLLIDSDNIALYRDDGLAINYNANGPKLDILRKK